MCQTSAWKMSNRTTTKKQNIELTSARFNRRQSCHTIHIHLYIIVYPIIAPNFKLRQKTTN